MQVADLLEKDIRRQPEGSQLPSENELAREHGISRLTARASLEELERRYLVRRTQGKRTLVARRIDYVITAQSPPSWTQMTKSAGIVGTSTVERISVRPASAEIRAKLALAEGARVTHIRRLELANDQLASCADAWVAQDVAPDLAETFKTGMSLFSVFSELNLQPYRKYSRAEFVVATPDVAARLQLDGRPLVLKLEGVTASKRLHRPIETTISYLRPDTLNVVFEMGSPP